MPAGKYCLTCGHPKSMHRHNKRKDGKMYYHGCQDWCKFQCKQYIEPAEKAAEHRVQLTAFGAGMRKRFGKVLVRLGRLLSKSGGN